MSIWDTAGKIIGGGIGSATDLASNIFHGITGIPTAEEKRNQQYAINDQIKAYKEQTALTEKQLAETRMEKDAQKRKINEKQIRSLRNSYRPAGGFLNGQANGTSNSLGSSNDLTNKLGV